MTSHKHTIFNRNLLLPLLIFAISLCVVFYQFLIIPKSTTFDEIEFAKLALQLKDKPYTPYSPYATGHATLYFYLILASFKLFGTSLFSLRFSSALFGIANPLIFYFVIKKIFNNESSSRHKSVSKEINCTDSDCHRNDTWIPFVLSFVFITLRWYFNFARFGFEVTFLLFLELTSLLFIILFVEKKQIRYLIFSAIFAGLSYNSYQPGRIFVLIPLVLLANHIFVNHIVPIKVENRQGMLNKLRRMCNLRYGINKSGLTTLLYFLVPFFILILPLTIYLNIHKDTRFYQQFYPDNHEMSFQEKKEFFVRNLISTSGIFLIKGDANGRHNYPNKPALNPIMGTFFILGLLIALFHIKNKYHLLFLFWFFVSLAPTLVTYPWENPNMLRTFTVIPSIVYFVGLTLKASKNLKIARNNKYNIVIVGILVFLLLVSSVYELKTYFVHQSVVFNEAFEAEHELMYYLIH